jgi:broad specificity polyphosphatase/5'/3'-nucleotidase SurE
MHNMVIEKEDRLILLTNDDGLYAAGLRTLLEIMEEFGKVVLVSTTESMSGMSQALTVKTPLRVKLRQQIVLNWLSISWLNDIPTGLYRVLTMVPTHR